MDSKLILVVIGVIATGFGRSQALSCYSCRSVDNNRKCKDPFRSDCEELTCNGAACVKTIVTKSGSTDIARYCLTDPVGKDECKEATFLGEKGIECVCRTELCNDGRTVKPTIYNVVIGAAMASVTAVAWMNQI